MHLGETKQDIMVPVLKCYEHFKQVLFSTSASFSVKWSNNSTYFIDNL